MVTSAGLSLNHIPNRQIKQLFSSEIGILSDKQTIYFFEQPKASIRNQIDVRRKTKVFRKNIKMATFRDPNQCFAPLEVIERLLEIRQETGFTPRLYLPQTQQLTDFLDAFGFDVYALTAADGKINFGDYRSPVVPGGDTHHTSAKAH